MPPPRVGYRGRYAPFVTSIVGLHVRGLNPPDISRRLLERQREQRAPAPVEVPKADAVRYILKTEGMLYDGAEGPQRRVSLAERQRRDRELGKKIVRMQEVDGKSQPEIVAALGINIDQLRSARRAYREFEQAEANPFVLLTPTTRKCLEEAGIDSVDKLAAQSEARLARLPRFGRVKRAEVASFLAAHGRALRAAAPAGAEAVVDLLDRVHPGFAALLVMPHAPTVSDIAAAAGSLAAQLDIPTSVWRAGLTRHGAINAAALVVVAAAANGKSGRTGRRGRDADGLTMLQSAPDQVDPWRTLYEWVAPPAGKKAARAPIAPVTQSPAVRRARPSGHVAVAAAAHR